MLKKIYFILFFILVIFISIISASIGYYMYDRKNSNNSNNLVESKQVASTDLFKQQEKPVDNLKVAKITPSTKMTYEYFYKGDNITEVVEDVPPYFLIDLTRNDLETNFKDWRVKSFSPTEVVMQKVIDDVSTQHYIVREYEGYVAIYYEKEINGTNLKEITDISLEGLPKEEQEKIKNGIKITGKENLMKFLESYGS